ncbi:uncharacterized protein LOC129808670 [Phlebotomus papatasi]|uniref:uncharacterized protein LOC129808670 n=1 Tax=Phlebotomus papatasi TaxID=29031 RepID=UPI002483FECC|nr:uncharacterized protein LOC129808670 [Phlebotomus papatasi]
MFQYADDIALLTENANLSECAETLTDDLSYLDEYFRKWRLKPNPTKTEVSIFHLNNRLAKCEIEVVFRGTLLQNNPTPKYLGVTLDRTLTYEKHLQSLSRKLGSRNNIISKVAGSTWGADAETLRQASLSLVYSTAEYCAPVWAGSRHCKKVDTQLNSTMRHITGTLKPTQTQWLPVLANIAPPHIRRNEATLREWSKAQLVTTPLQNIVNNAPSLRLKSRNPFWNRSEMLRNGNFSSKQQWNKEWGDGNYKNSHLIDDPSKPVEGLNLSRKDWATLNRIRTGCARTAANLHKWGIKDDPKCDCGCPTQTLQHIINECPRRRFDGGLNSLNNLTAEARLWLSNLDVQL